MILYYEMLVEIVLNNGGWYNCKVIDLFEKYGKMVFDCYNKKVKYWIVIN